MGCFVVTGFVLTGASRSPSVNFRCPIHISGMAEARAIKFCTKGDYIKSSQRDDKSPLKGAWFCSRDPFCSAQLWTYKKFRHRTLLAGINKTDDGLLIITLSTVDACAAVH